MKKLSYKSDWEADKYFIGKKQITDLNLVNINDKNYNVISKSVTVPYNDMGHEYSSTSMHYFVEEQVLGITMRIDLNTIVNKGKVFAVEYSLQEND